MITPTTRWTPRVTVASIIEHGGRYLLVEEDTRDGLRLNNPAGHLEAGESLVQACVRETLEETACGFVPEALVGVYLHRFVRTGGEELTYLRFGFAGTLGERIAGRALDDGIVGSVWLTPEEIRADVQRLRSPLVLQCVEDHLAGHRYPLDLLTTNASVYALAAAAQEAHP